MWDGSCWCETGRAGVRRGRAGLGRGRAGLGRIALV